MNKEILGDLRQRYGDKVLLDPKDLESALGISTGQQANLRSSGQFPIKTTKIGNKVKVTIYDLADYLSGACDEEVKVQLDATQGTLSRPEKKARRGHLEKDWWCRFSQAVYAAIDKQRLDSTYPLSPASAEGLQI